ARLGEGDQGGVVARLEVAGCIADLDGQRAGVPGSEVGGRAGEGEVVGGAGDDAERGRVEAERVGAGADRERAGEGAGDGLRRDAAGDGCRPQPSDAADAARPGERDDGRVVARFQVAGRITDLGGQRASGAGGEVSG